MTTSLVHDLDVLHAGYVASINEAIGANDLTLAQELAAAYDAEAIRMMAEREGLTHLLPLTRPTTPSRLQRLVARLRHPQAA